MYSMYPQQQESNTNSVIPIHGGWSVLPRWVILPVWSLRVVLWAYVGDQNLPAKI